MALPVFLPYLLGQDFAAPAAPWATEKYWTPAELAFKGSSTPPPITGSGASSIAFTDAGTAILEFVAMGASSAVFTDAGTAVLEFVGAGNSAVVFTDAGTGAVANSITGAGASSVAFADSGVGSVAAAGGGGGSNGGGFRFDWDKAFPRKRAKEPARPRRLRKLKTPSRVFAYVSETSTPVFFDAGAGRVLMAGGGVSQLMFRSIDGRGDMEESAAEFIGALFMLDEE